MLAYLMAPDRDEVYRLICELVEQLNQQGADISQVAGALMFRSVGLYVDGGVTLPPVQDQLKRMWNGIRDDREEDTVLN